MCRFLLSIYNQRNTFISAGANYLGLGLFRLIKAVEMAYMYLVYMLMRHLTIQFTGLDFFEQLLLLSV